jgi:hypothetical protein
MDQLRTISSVIDSMAFVQMPLFLGFDMLAPV